MTAAPDTVRKRFPWNIVKGWTVASCADGTLRVEPQYINTPAPDGEGGPGLFTRMRLAAWAERRLCKRGSR